MAIRVEIQGGGNAPQFIGTTTDLLGRLQTAVTSRYIPALNDANAVGARSQGVFAGLTSALGSMASVAGGNLISGGIAAITSALTGMAASGVRSAGDLQSSLALLRVQSGATAEEMQEVSRTAKALGADTALPKTSALNAAQAMLELSKAGLSVDDTLKAARGTLQLAAAGGLSEAESAKIAANALNTFHLEGNQAARVANVLAAAANASSADVRDLAQGVQQGGFAFQASGQKLEDLVASVSLLTNVGLTGSDAGTALKNAMIRLMSPTDEASKLMKRLGFNAYDAQGKMKPLRTIIAEMNTALANATPQMRNQSLETIFMSDGMKAMIPLLDAGTAGYDKMMAAVSKASAAQDLAGARSGGLMGSIDALKSSFETFLLNAAEPLLAPLEGIVRQMNAGIPTIERLGVSFGAFTAGALTTALAWLNSTGLPMLQSGLDFVSQNWTKFQGAAMGVGALLAGGLGIMGIVATLSLLVNPLTWLIAGAAALGIAWTENWGGIQEKTQAAVPVVVQAVLDAINTLQMIGFIAQWATSTAGESLRQLGLIIAFVVFDWLLAISNFGNSVITTLQGLPAQISGMVSQFATAGMGLGKSILDGLIEGIKARIAGVIGAMVAALRDIERAARDAVGAKSPAAAFIALGEDINAGLALPFINGNAAPVAAMKSLMGNVQGAASAPIGGGAFAPAFAGLGAGSAPLAPTGSNITINININVDNLSSALDVETMAHQIAGIIQRKATA